MIRYFRCDKCGNLVESVHSSGVPMVCCGEKMTELTANTVDAAVEKHVILAYLPCLVRFCNQVLNHLGVGHQTCCPKPPCLPA